MFRGLLSSRLIQIGLVFFVVVVGGSLLYSWQTRRATVAEFTRTDVVPHEKRSEQDTIDTSTDCLTFLFFVAFRQNSHQLNEMESMPSLRPIFLFRHFSINPNERGE